MGILARQCSCLQRFVVKTMKHTIAGFTKELLYWVAARFCDCFGSMATVNRVKA